jgi:hypothetical protein
LAAGDGVEVDLGNEFALGDFAQGDVELLLVLGEELDVGLHAGIELAHPFRRQVDEDGHAGDAGSGIFEQF